MLVCIVGACSGDTTQATGVTDTAATLTADASCAATTTGNPCTAWFQYWAEGTAQPISTARQVWNSGFSNATIQQALSGLQPATLYRYQFCGFGDGNISPPGLCAGQVGGNAVSAPGATPPVLPTSPGSPFATGNLSAFSSFLTAQPGAVFPTNATVDLGRVLASDDAADYSTAVLTGSAVGRDGGYSVALDGTAGRALWLFGDTGFGCTNAQTGFCYFVGGGTAAAGPSTPGQAPTSLMEVPTPGVAPANGPSQPRPFFPTPQAVQFNFNGAPVSCVPVNTSAAISGTTLTALVPASGTIAVGQNVYGLGVAPGTMITKFLSGNGQTALYSVNISQNAAYTYVNMQFGSAHYAAAWPLGAAAIANSTHVLLAYAAVCVTASATAVAEQIHLAVYDPASNSFLSDNVPFAAAPLTAGLRPLELLSSPVFGNDGYVYLYSSTNQCTALPGCRGTVLYPNAIYTTRAPASPGGWSSGANFQWWGMTSNGQPGWTTEARARPAITFPAGLGPVSVHTADYSGVSPHRFVALTQTSYGQPGQQTRFSAFEAASPAGPFHLLLSGATPDDCTLGSGCYAVIGHPELSTSKQLVFSWFSTDDRLNSHPTTLNGHVRVGAIDW